MRVRAYRSEQSPKQPQHDDQGPRKPSDPMMEPGQQNQPPQWLRVVNFLLLTFLIFYAVEMLTQPNAQDLTYSEFKERVTSGQVSEVTIEGHQVRGMLKATEGSSDASGEQSFQSYVPEVGETRIVELLEQNNVPITAKESGPDLLSRLLVNFLPWLIIFGIFLYIWQRVARQMTSQQGGGGLFSMGKNKAKRFREDDPRKPLPTLPVPTTRRKT